MIYSTHSSLNGIWCYSIGIVKIIQEGTRAFLSLVKVEVYARIGVSYNPYLALDKQDCTLNLISFHVST